MRKRLVIRDSTTIRNKVYHYVREQILKGEIGPEERLIEARLAEEIGTSRTPVREALHSLEREGLIESIPRVGYKVKSISDREVAEICEIRCVIENLAAGWAVEKAREKLTRELAKNIALAEERVSQGDIAAFVELDAQFHEIIAGLSGSQRLLELAQTLRRHMLRYRIQSLSLPGTALTAIDGHRGILRAIEAGDPEGILRAIRIHLDQSKTDSVRYAFQDEPARGDGKT